MTQITGGRKRKREKKKRSPSPVQNCFVDFDPSGESVASIAVRTACSRYRGEWHYKGQSVARNVFATTTIKRTTALFSKLELSDIRWGYRGRAHRWVSKPGRLISSRVHRARAPPLPPATRSSRYVTIFQLRVANNSSSWPPNFEKMRGGKGAVDLNFEGCYRRGGRFVEVEEREEDGVQVYEWAIVSWMGGLIFERGMKESVKRLLKIAKNLWCTPIYVMGFVRKVNLSNVLSLRIGLTAYFVPV